MSEETNARQPSNPMEVWEQWYAAASKGWSSAMNLNGHEDDLRPNYPDPLSFYRTWIKGVSDVQELFRNSYSDPQELWKRWFETLTDTWKRAIEAVGDPLGLAAQWQEMMEEARATLFGNVNFPADPFTLFKQWYDATNETWSTLIGNVIGTEKFMEAASEFLKSYTSFYGTWRRMNEEYFRNLQLPTRTDLAHLAELVINLENKVDRIDSLLEDLTDTDTKSMIHASVEPLLARVEGLENRLDRVESKLDTLLSSFEKLAARDSSVAAEPPRRLTRKSNTQSRKTSKSESPAES